MPFVFLWYRDVEFAFSRVSSRALKQTTIGQKATWRNFSLAVKKDNTALDYYRALPKSRKAEFQLARALNLLKLSCVRLFLCSCLCCCVVLLVLFILCLG